MVWWACWSAFGARVAAGRARMKPGKFGLTGAAAGEGEDEGVDEGVDAAGEQGEVSTLEQSHRLALHAP